MEVAAFSPEHLVGPQQDKVPPYLANRAIQLLREDYLGPDGRLSKDEVVWRELAAVQSGVQLPYAATFSDNQRKQIMIAYHQHALARHRHLMAEGTPCWRHPHHPKFPNWLAGKYQRPTVSPNTSVS